MIAEYVVDFEKLFPETFKKFQCKKPLYSGEIKQGVYLTKVIYNNPVTVCIWSDGTKTSSRCQEGDVYNPEAGLAIAALKKIHGVENTVRLLDEWRPASEKEGVSITSLKDVRKRYRQGESNEEA